MSKPISPKRHGAIDYGFLAVGLAGPTLLGLNGAARVVFGLLALAQGTLNAFSDHALALKRVVPFRLHGRLELGGIPIYVVLPLVTGALEGARAYTLYFGAGAVLLAVYLLTDWKATNTDV
jgi:hypothetical protein